MRQGQQNRRGRGRGGRKGQNPLSRSFESSGPDIKIRGTAQHIAEKYMALARDAIGSGDLVLGENYLQHAEHYNRIIMAAQTQPQNGYGEMNGNGQRIARPEGDLSDSDSFDGDDEGDGDQPGMAGGFEQPRPYEPNNNNHNNNGPREHQGNPQHQPRYRDNRNYDNRNSYDSRNNQSRSFEPRGQGGTDQRNDHRNNDNRNAEHRGNDQRRQEPRDTFEPRYQGPARDGNGAGNGSVVGAGNGEQPPNLNGDQPRVIEAPRQPADNREAQPPFEPRPQGDSPGPRGRRRRSRHENGANRPYPPQVASDDPNAPSHDPQPVVSAPDTGNDGNDGGEGQS